MSAQHTPGPWTAIVHADWPHRQDVYITAQQWGVIGVVSIDPSLEHLVDAQRANLRLIAAAPDMLAALEDALEFLQDWEDLSGGPAARKARAAIAKATGSVS